MPYDPNGALPVGQNPFAGSGASQLAQVIQQARAQLDSQPQRLAAQPDDNSEVLYRTSSPLVNITQHDIDKAIHIGMAVSGGGLATVRPYGNVPDSLMGFRRNGPQKGFDESNYPHTQDVQVVFPDREVMTDQIKGMNADHALERAHRNWQDAIHIFAPNKP